MKKQSRTLPQHKTPLERMTELTRRLIAVPKSEVLKKKQTKHGRPSR